MKYRLLSAKDLVRPGDQFRTEAGNWIVTVGHGAFVTERMVGRYRRAVPAEFSVQSKRKQRVSGIIEQGPAWATRVSRKTVHHTARHNLSMAAFLIQHEKPCMNRNQRLAYRCGKARVDLFLDRVTVKAGK